MDVAIQHLQVAYGKIHAGAVVHFVMGGVCSETLYHHPSVLDFGARVVIQCGKPHDGRRGSPKHGRRCNALLCQAVLCFILGEVLGFTAFACMQNLALHSIPPETCH